MIQPNIIQKKCVQRWMENKEPVQFWCHIIHYSSKTIICCKINSAATAGCIDSGMHTTDYHKIINNECCNQICTHKDRRNQDSNAQLIVTIQDAMHKMMLDALASKKNLNNVLPDTTGHPIKDSNPLISSADGLPVAPLLELDTLIGHSFTLWSYVIKDQRCWPPSYSKLKSADIWWALNKR